MGIRGAQAGVASSVPRFGVLLAAFWASPALAGGPVRITSMVEGAQVQVDGVDQGVVTPATIDSLPAGTHEVVAIAGCQRGSKMVAVPEEGAVEAFIEMAPANGTIVVQPIPAEAHVSIDGVPVTGALGAPSEVACGSHAVAAQHSGFQPTFVTLDVGPGDEVVLPLRLQPLGFGRLVVDVLPDSSRVLIDGNQLSVGPVDTNMVVEGPHVLRVEAEGHNPAERQFVLTAGMQASFDIELTPLPDYKPPRERRGAKGTAVAGVVLGLGGVASGVVSALEYRRTTDAYDEYSGMMDSANADNDDALAQRARSFYDEDVRPHVVGTWASGVAAGVLLAGGVTLVVAF